MLFRTRRIFATVIIVFSIIGVSFFILRKEFATHEGPEEPMEVKEELTGNLIMDDSKPEDGWLLSYEKEGSPGMIANLNYNPARVDCYSSEGRNCLFFFEEMEDLAGARVKVSGFLNDVFDLDTIEFLEF